MLTAIGLGALVSFLTDPIPWSITGALVRAPNRKDTQEFFDELDKIWD